MGCFKFLSNIVNTIITLLVSLIFLFPCGGLNMISNFIYSKFNPPEKVLQVNAQKIADFSKMPKNYKLVKTFDMLGINGVIAQSTDSTQKMAIVNTGYLFNVTKKDIETNQVITKIEDTTKTLKNYNIKMEQFELLKKGSFKAFNQNVPYIKAKFTIAGAQNRAVEGILGVATRADSKNNLIISISENGNYKQKNAENFFKYIQLNKN